MNRELQGEFSTPASKMGGHKRTLVRTGIGADNLRSSGNNKTESLRERFIEETEAYLTRNLKNEQRPWPCACSPKSTTRDEQRWRGQRVGYPAHRLLCRDGLSIVQVNADASGLLDSDAISALIHILDEVAERIRAGDVVVDLSQLRLLTAQIMNILSGAYHRCVYSGRQMVLCGGGISHSLWLRNAGAPIQWFSSQQQAIRHLSVASQEP
jgi:hypothetical protein